VKTIIHEIAEKFIKNIVKKFEEQNCSIGEIEKEMFSEAKKTAAALATAYIENIDVAIAADKTGRKEAGYQIERRNDVRTIQTLVGEITYERTYYKNVSGGYEYLADTVVGIESRTRVSQELTGELVKAAKDMSYGKAAYYLTGREISRQTVMNGIRWSETVKEEVSRDGKRRVQELHIDADEAHITLYGGKKSEVPLVSVYEGIEHNGKRHSCKNIFHISEYGMNSDDLWEHVLDEIESRYDIEGTQIYLHGDGAAWIGKGLEWVPRSIFVLDKYHKNKAIKQMTAGLDKVRRKLYDKEIREALYDENIWIFEKSVNELCEQFPERVEKIIDAAKYLWHFVEGISICKRDSRANNGGCTEPHVSHILSARLSSRPMAWSVKTLKQLSPILAGGGIRVNAKKLRVELPESLQNTVTSASNVFCKVKNTLGMPNPDAIGALQPLSSGKVTSLYRTFKNI